MFSPLKADYRRAAEADAIDAALTLECLASRTAGDHAPRRVSMFPHARFQRLTPLRVGQQAPSSLVTATLLLRAISDLRFQV